MNEAGTGHQVGQTANCWMMGRTRIQMWWLGGGWCGRVSSDMMCV